MRRKLHQTLGARKHAVAPDLYYDFKVGARVMADGFHGTVTDVQDGPYPGTETYIVKLDGGGGGGEYLSRQLAALDHTTASSTDDQDQYDSGVGGDSTDDLNPIEAGAHTSAAFWYPELGNILDDRLPNENIKVYAGLQRTAAGEWHPGVGSGDAGTIRCDNCGEDHPATYSHEGQFNQGPIYAVVCPKDQLTDYYTAERLAPKKAALQEPLDEDADMALGGKNQAETKQDKIETADATNEPAEAPEEPPSTCSFCGSQQFGDFQDTGRGTRARCMACGGTMVKNPEGIQWQPEFPNSSANAPSRMGDPRATINDPHAVVGSREYPATDAETLPYGYDDLTEFREDHPERIPHTADQGDWCRFRMNQQCMLPQRLNPHATAEAGYTIFTPQQRGLCNRYTATQQQACPTGMPILTTPGRQVDPMWVQSSFGGPHFPSQGDHEFVWHFTSSWRDVEAKAKRIRAEGGVRVLAANGEGVVGEVRGDTATYEATLHYVPGSKKVADWSCGCKWAAYAWGRSPAYRRFEGRQCSHVAALRFEVGARGMFGRDVALDTERMEGQHQRSPVQEQHQRGTDRSPEKPLTRRTVPPGNMRTEWTPRSRVRIKGSLHEDITPAQEWARVLTATGKPPADVLVALRDLGLTHKGAREVLAWATSGPMSGQAQVNGEMHQVVHVDPHTELVTLATGQVVPAAQVFAPNWHPTIGLDPHQAAKEKADDEEEGEATADPMGGTAEPGTDIPRLDKRDQTDAKKDKRHILHHTNDAREHAPEFGHGLPWGGNYAWCDQCNGSGCGHCGGTGQVVVGQAPTTVSGGVGDASMTTSPIADQNDDAGDAISGDGLSATGAMAAPCETPGAQYSTSVGGDSAAIKVELPFELPVNTEGDAKDLEARMHNAMESVMAPYFVSHIGSRDPMFWWRENHRPFPVGEAGPSLDYHELMKQADYTADSFLTGPPAQNYQAPTPHSNSDNPVSTGWAASADPPNWEQPIIGSGFGLSWDAALHTPQEVTWQPESPDVRTAKREGDPSLPAQEAPTHAGVALKAADTGRILMIQRSHQDQSDPARGTWEFPGGGVEDGDETSLHAAIREFEEEVGQSFPQGGHVSHVWRSGPYAGHVVVIPSESQVDFSNGRATVNPDDPDGDDHEQSAWWDPDHARKNPALREECKSNPWGEIKKAASVSYLLPPQQARYLTLDEVREVARQEEQRTGKTSEQLLRERAAWQEQHFATLHEEPEPALPSTDGGSDNDSATTPESLRGDGESATYKPSEPVEPQAAQGTPVWPDVTPGVPTDRNTAWGYPEASPQTVDGEVPDPGSADHDTLTDDVTNNLPFRVDAGLQVKLTPEMAQAAQTSPILAQFWASAGARALQEDTPASAPSDRQVAMSGQSRSVGREYSDSDIHAAAQAMLQKMGAKDFSYAEQRELIDEGLTSGARARNFDDLKLAGTHYERLGADQEEEWPF